MSEAIRALSPNGFLCPSPIRAPGRGFAIESVQRQPSLSIFEATARLGLSPSSLTRGVEVACPEVQVTHTGKEVRFRLGEVLEELSLVDDYKAWQVRGIVGMFERLNVKGFNVGQKRRTVGRLKRKQGGRAGHDFGRKTKTPGRKALPGPPRD